MTNGEQGGQGGGQRTYSEEDVMALMNEAARRGANEAMKNAPPPRDDDDDDMAVSVINPKVVKQLKDTVAVFTALKELSSNPLQRTIEETVGGMAASVVQNAFSPRGPPPKQDILDKMLNSQFAYGLGSGLGQRAPELVETMGKTFGQDRAGQMMDSIIGKYGSGGSGGGGQSRQLNPGPSSPSGHSSTPPASSTTSEQKTDKQTEKELLLSLDPNNPEHVSAYAETQGGLPVDVARKMLMIHQDAFIEQLKRDGMNVDQISTQRGSRAQPSPHIQQPSTAQTPSSPHMSQGAPPTPPDNVDSIEYADYQDVSQPGQVNSPRLGQQPGQTPQGGPDNQQTEMMKIFATDIGKVMGEMLNKIENINNTVFTLQNEMNNIKKQGPRQSPSVNTEMPPRVPPRVAEQPSGIAPPIIREHVPLDTPSLEVFADYEDQTIDTEDQGIKRSEDFFKEDVIDISSFKQELEEEAKADTEKLKQNAQPPEPIQPVVQPIPPSVVRPIPPPIIRSVPPVVVQPVPPPVIVRQTVQPVQPPINIPVPIKDNITDIPKTKDGDEISKLDTTHTIHDNKFVTPIKKAGIHKKAAYKNLAPSFKKGEEKENNKENIKENNIDKEV